MILRVVLRSCLHGVCVSGELVEWVVDESECECSSITHGRLQRPRALNSKVVELLSCTVHNPNLNSNREFE